MVTGKLSVLFQQRVEYCAMVYAQELEESRENGDLNNVFILDYDRSWFMVRDPF